MERRVSRRMALHRRETLLNPKLDPILWSELPRENLLDIFDALPVNDHYRLRDVCKQWHNRVSERRGLPAQDQGFVREPFFLLIPKSLYERSPYGTLALHAASGQWIWRLSKLIRNNRYLCHPIGHILAAFEVEGMVFSGGCYTSNLDSLLLCLTYVSVVDALLEMNRINSRFPFPDFMNTPHKDVAPESVLGMMVNEASRTYKVIVGSCATDTLILDSRTNEWESKPSRLVRDRPPCASVAPKSCVQLQGKMYIWIDSDEIQVYSPSLDEWKALAAPPRDVSNEDECRGLGHWVGVLYAVTKNEQGTLSVWKLDMVDGQWSKHAQIPGSMFEHLMHPGAVLPIAVSHWNGYFLVHVLAQPDFELYRRETRGHVVNLATIYLSELLKEERFWRPRPMKLGCRFVLFNIANKRWEMVDMSYSKLWKGCDIY